MPNLQLACVVGARPNFTKMAPLLRALEKYPRGNATLVHAGQHCDENLSDIFFRELGMKRPDVSLEVGSGKHGAQTAWILEKFEAVLEQGPEAREQRTKGGRLCSPPSPLFLLDGDPLEAQFVGGRTVLKQVVLEFHQRRKAVGSGRWSQVSGVRRNHEGHGGRQRRAIVRPTSLCPRMTNRDVAICHRVRYNSPVALCRIRESISWLPTVQTKSGSTFVFLPN